MVTPTSGAPRARRPGPHRAVLKPGSRRSVRPAPDVTLRPVGPSATCRAPAPAWSRGRPASRRRRAVGRTASSISPAFASGPTSSSSHSRHRCSAGRPVGAAPRGDAVVTELARAPRRRRRAAANLAGGADPRYRAHRTVPDNGQHHIQQFGRYAVVAVAVVASKVPALRCGRRGPPAASDAIPLDPAGAAAQRDSFGSPDRGRRVEVHRVQRLRLGVARPGRSPRYR